MSVDDDDENDDDFGGQKDDDHHHHDRSKGKGDDTRRARAVNILPYILRGREREQEGVIKP